MLAALAPLIPAEAAGRVRCRGLDAPTAELTPMAASTRRHTAGTAKRAIAQPSDACPARAPERYLCPCRPPRTWLLLRSDRSAPGSVSMLAERDRCRVNTRMQPPLEWWRRKLLGLALYLIRDPSPCGVPIRAVIVQTRSNAYLSPVVQTPRQRGDYPLGARRRKRPAHDPRHRLEGRCGRARATASGSRPRPQESRRAPGR